MPTTITYPAVGLKHSETPTLTTLGGDELALAIRPQASDPTKFENVNIPIALLGGLGGATPIVAFLPDGRAILNDVAQRLLAAGELYWLHPDSTGVYRQVNANTSPTNTPGQNSQALMFMAAGLPQP